MQITSLDITLKRIGQIENSLNALFKDNAEGASFDQALQNASQKFNLPNASSLQYINGVPQLPELNIGDTVKNGSNNTGLLPEINNIINKQ